MEQPIQSNMSEALQTISQGLDRIMAGEGASMDRQGYVRVYTLIHNYCVTGKPNPSKAELGPMKKTDRDNTSSPRKNRGAHLLGEELYHFLDDYLKRYLKNVHAELNTQSGDELVAAYTEQWKRFVVAAKQNERLFRFLERHWIQRERDEGKTTILSIYPLHLTRWREVILETDDGSIGDNLRERIEEVKQKQIELDAQANSIEALTESFIALGIEDPELQRQVSSSSLSSWAIVDHDPEQATKSEGQEAKAAKATEG